MKLSIYIGFDSRNDGQQLAFDICKKSILMNTNHLDKLLIQPLVLKELEKIGFNREYDVLASTEFTYTRFLTPYLNNYEGIAIFCDSDFLWECDIYKELMPYIENMINKNAAVCCVKHEYHEIKIKKMDNLPQTSYPKKNWSSFIIYNCSHEDVKNLTLENINIKSPAWLHRFNWCEDKNILELPYTYNYLVGIYNDINSPKVIHYTNGGPWHYLYREIEFYQNWLKYLDEDQKVRLDKELERQKLKN